MDKLASYKYRLFAVGALGTFMSTFQGSIVNVALPSIAEDLGASIDAVAWVVMAYTVTLISLMLVFGAWTRRMGYAFSYKFGYVFFVIGSAVCGYSDSMTVLIVGRVAQAVGTAMFAAVGPAMITDIFPPGERGKGIGMMVMMVSLGFMVGPPVGGLMLSVWDWPSVFLIGIPIGLVGFGLAARYFKDYQHRIDRRKLPLASTFSMSVALVVITYGLSQIGDKPLFDPEIVALFAIGVISLSLFALFESRPGQAMIGLSIFRNRRFVTSVIAQQAQFISFSGPMILIPFYLERVLGLAPRQVGLFLVVIPVAMFVLAPISGKVSDRIGARWPSAMGMLGVLAGLFMLSGLAADTASSYVVVSLFVMGSGAGLFSSPNSAALMQSVADEQRQVASAILATGRNIGITLGVAFSTAVFDHLMQEKLAVQEYAPAFLDSFEQVVWIAVVIASVGLVICLIRDD